MAASLSARVSMTCDLCFTAGEMVVGRHTGSFDDLYRWELAQCHKWTGRFGLRGRGGRIALRLLAWKAATRIEAGRAFLAKAPENVCCERVVADILVTEGGLVESLVEKDRLDAAAQTWRRVVDLTIEAILCMISYSPPGYRQDAMGSIQCGIKIEMRSRLLARASSEASPSARTILM